MRADRRETACLPGSPKGEAKRRQRRMSLDLRLPNNAEIGSLGPETSRFTCNWNALIRHPTFIVSASNFGKQSSRDKNRDRFVSSMNNAVIESVISHATGISATPDCHSHILENVRMILFRHGYRAEFVAGLVGVGVKAGLGETVALRIVHRQKQLPRLDGRRQHRAHANGITTGAKGDL